MLCGANNWDCFGAVVELICRGGCIRASLSESFGGLFKVGKLLAICVIDL